ncbi:MAG: hypothetical protein WAL14_17950, partial [Pseudolabrys sp.]
AFGASCCCLFPFAWTGTATASKAIAIATVTVLILHPDVQDFSAIDRTNNHHWFGAESGRKPRELPARVGIYVNVMQRLVYRAAFLRHVHSYPKSGH